MRIWIDLSNSPHVPFFLPIATEFERRGHEVIWTARDYAQTLELADNAGLRVEVFGKHGGGSVAGKVSEFASRTLKVTQWARGRKIGLVVVHNSQEPLLVARMLGFDSVNLMDYEFHPGNKLSFRTARRLVLPRCFPADAISKLGVAESKVQRYDGIKEDVYLANFEPDPLFVDSLAEYGIRGDHILIVVRPHAPEALYNRSFQNDLIDVFLEHASNVKGVKVILLPRKPDQGKRFRERHPSENVIIPDRALNGPELLCVADLVVSGGGTMNREAAALGVPTATIFTGHMAAVDKYLIELDRLAHLSSADQIRGIHFEKKPDPQPRKVERVLSQVVDIILSHGPGREI